ncbi:MBL fold metallo-hydrolase [Flectobacillus major]|uniref:MBL fold metallo-hydrolase n=1 Tax=Flectobacillus major TaxID=103 RepID=UPI0003FB11E7|nr:MBL fold metallo-hydrolase [Flectobacillus major]
MIQLEIFTFNPFQENTYVLWDKTLECVIIDPGCHVYEERKILTDFITSKQLKPVKLLNTHAHIDHILGNAFIKRTYSIGLHLHAKDIPVLESAPSRAAYWGFPAYEHTEVDTFLEEGTDITFGNTTLEVLFTPGHAPGHVVFYHKGQQLVIGGDVLFRGSVGRTDLPLCSFADLEKSIKTKLYTLPDTTTVYPGHGPSTTIGFEKKNNPFVKL